jgi:hypothetical protein
LAAHTVSSAEALPGAGPTSSDGVVGETTSPPAAGTLEAALAEWARLARQYRASLERVLTFQEEAAARTAATARNRRDLLARGLVSRREVDDSERAAAAALDALEATRAAIARVDEVIVEAEAVPEVAALPAPEPGEVRELPTLIVHAGPAGWTPAVTARLQQLFQERFGRPLPLSAVGQTALHTRLGFDHRSAIDVAVHPESPEGQAVIAWLRAQGVSFLAFRARVRGESSGAHLHVGEPSPRLISLPP